MQRSVTLNGFLWGSGIAALLCGGASYFVSCPWVQDVLLGLGFMLAGIVVTITVVEKLLTDHELKQWTNARPFILARVDRAAFITIASLRVALGIDSSPVDWTPDDMSSPVRRRKKMIELTREVILPSLEKQVESIDTTAWAILVQNLWGAWTEGERVIEVFGSQLDPNVQAEILGLQDAIFSIRSVHSTNEPLLGVPDESLPPNAVHESAKLKRAALRSITIAIQRALETSANLLAIIESSGDIDTRNGQS